MDFREELKAAVEQCVRDQQSSANHVVHQAFLAGVGWHMKYVREKLAKPSTPSDPMSVL
jgi:hypothetical protein